MGKAVVQGSDGDTASGSYDGYGNLSGSTGHTELADMDGKFALYHKVCFKLLGRPEFTGPSHSANDQGMPPSDEFPEPRNADDLRALKELAAAARRKAKAEGVRRRACGDAEQKLLGSAAKCPHCHFDTFFVIERKGALMIRCPSRDCKKLRSFPTGVASAWRALAAEYVDQPVIWDDRKIGPHFEEAVSLQHQVEKFENELKESHEHGYTEDDEYLTKRITQFKVEQAYATVKAQAAEDAEVVS
jgi:hypothetical protein